MSNNGPGIRGRRALWAVFHVTFVAACLLAVMFAILPGYTSPNSKSWSEPTGYPAMLRALGLPIPVTTERIVRRDVLQVVAASGTLEYRNLVQIAPDINGIVTTVSVMPGSEVHQGDQLLVLDSGGFGVDQARLEVQQKEVDYEQAKRDYNRDAAAYAKGLVSRSTFEATDKNYQDAAVALARARVSLAKALVTLSETVYGARKPPTARLKSEAAAEQPLRLVAPIDGTVTDISARSGQMVFSPGPPLVTLGNTLVFRAVVDQRDVRRIKPGDAAVVRLEALPGVDLPSTVERIDPVVAEASQKSSQAQQPEGTVYAWLQLNGPPPGGERLLSGMSGYCVANRKMESLAVPESAVMRLSAGEGTILVVGDDNRVQVAPILYSVNEGGWVGLISGPPEGTRVVLDGQIGLRAGDRVRFK